MVEKEDSFSLWLWGLFQSEYRGRHPSQLNAEEAAEFCHRFRVTAQADVDDSTILSALHQVAEEVSHMSDGDLAVATLKAAFEAAFEKLMGAPCAVKAYKNGSIAFVVSDVKKAAERISHGSSMRFSYQWEKFTAAQRSLMLPHPGGEGASIANAFHSCSLGLKDFSRESVDDNVRNWLLRLDELMDVTGLEQVHGKGLWQLRGESLTTDEKFELSTIIGELADWFSCEMWSTSR